MLKKGINPAETQTQPQIDLASLPPEKRREMENGMVLLKLRRYWRFFAIAWAIAATLYMIPTALRNDEPLYLVPLLGIAYGAVVYAVGMFVLYALGYRVLKLYFYLRDLRSDKATRL